MRMLFHNLVVLALFASLAVAQTSPTPQSNVPSGAPLDPTQHRDDDEPPPASAASVRSFCSACESPYFRCSEISCYLTQRKALDLQQAIKRR
jgi:hypothetical protein